jgi:hypothetical protein
MNLSELSNGQRFIRDGKTYVRRGLHGVSPGSDPREEEAGRIVVTATEVGQTKGRGSIENPLLFFGDEQVEPCE